MQIKNVAFDADDTLWENETYFRDAEGYFCELMKEFLPIDQLEKRLFDMEMKNLPLYGYGIKPFILSLIEAAQEISKGQVSNNSISKLIDLGKDMLQAPVVLINGVEDTLKQLKNKGYRLVVATKGDLLDQERKLIKSGLEPYFHHIEVMADKKPRQYHKLINHLDINIDEFLMVGNSPKSDILPVLEIGGWAFHIPFHTTWKHENVSHPIQHEHYQKFIKISELLTVL